MDGIIIEAAEDACRRILEHIVNEYSSKNKLVAMHIATKIPGMCHTHEPTDELVENCPYCNRRGNVFSGEKLAISDVKKDLVRRPVEEICQVLLSLAREVDTYM
jgi:hypothetical protein